METRYRWLALITVVAAAMRFYGLADEGLWLDETYTAERMRLDLSEMITNGIWHGQAPLYNLISRAWCAVAGQSEWALRAPAAAFGLLCVPAIFLLGRQVFDARVGIAAAWLMTINPYALHYSQEARVYTLFLLLSIVAYYFFYKLLTEPSCRANRWGYATFTTLALCSHPYSVFLAVSMWASVFGFAWLHRGKLRSRYWKDYLAPTAFAAVLYAPICGWFGVIYFLGARPANFLGTRDVPTIWSTFARYWAFPHLATVVAIVVVVAVFLRLRDKMTAEAWSRLLLIGSILVSFLVIPWAASILGKPILHHRYTIVALGAIVLAAAWAVDFLSRHWRPVAMPAVTLIALLPLYDHYAHTSKDSWSQLATVLRPHVRPGDVIVPSIDYTHAAVEYYVPPSETGVRVCDEHTSPEELVEYRRIWLIRQRRTNWKTAEIEGQPLHRVRVHNANPAWLRHNNHAMTIELYETPATSVAGRPMAAKETTRY